MWSALRRLADRVLSRHAHEPAGQNGFDCLLLAALDQLDDLGEQLPGMDATSLRGSAQAWMRENATLVVSDWSSTAVQNADLSRLCDYGREYFDFLHEKKAVGNHVVVLAICAVLSIMLNKEVRAQVSAGMRQSCYIFCLLTLRALLAGVLNQRRGL